MEIWGNYLAASLPDPGDQLCTDDFEGPSPHNVNLAAKVYHYVYIVLQTEVWVSLLTKGLFEGIFVCVIIAMPIIILANFKCAVSITIINFRFLKHHQSVHFE